MILISLRGSIFSYNNSQRKVHNAHCRVAPVIHHLGICHPLPMQYSPRTPKYAPIQLRKTVIFTHNQHNARTTHHPGKNMKYRINHSAPAKWTAQARARCCTFHASETNLMTV